LWALDNNAKRIAGITSQAEMPVKPLRCFTQRPSSLGPQPLSLRLVFWMNG